MIRSRFAAAVIAAGGVTACATEGSTAPASGAVRADAAAGRAAVRLTADVVSHNARAGTSWCSSPTSNLAAPPEATERLHEALADARPGPGGPAPAGEAAGLVPGRAA